MDIFYGLYRWGVPLLIRAGERYFESDEGKVQIARARALGAKIFIPLVANAGDPIPEIHNDNPGG